MRWLATLAFMLKVQRTEDLHLVLVAMIMVKHEHVRDLNDSRAHFVERILNSGVL